MTVKENGHPVRKSESTSMSRGRGKRKGHTIHTGICFFWNSVCKSAKSAVLYSMDQSQRKYRDSFSLSGSFLWLTFKR